MHEQDMTEEQFFLMEKNKFEFRVFLLDCYTKFNKPSLHYYLPQAKWRIVRFMPFPRVLVRCPMQRASFRIWTGVSALISFDDNLKW